MAYLLWILVAVTMISLCSAQCMMEQNGKIGFNAHKHSFYSQHKNGCWKDGNFHKLKDEWDTSDCTKCFCYPDHIMCCANYKKPILKDPETCVAVLNKTICEMEVKQKDNSGETCEVESWIF